MNERGWSAELALSFEARAGRTVLDRARHFGPLRVQRPFHPEPDGGCHVYVLHPPGGIVGGDELTIEVEARASASALITTPGATKFYRSEGRRATLRQELRVHGGASLEWLPQDTIVFRGAEASISTRVTVEEGSTFFGWEVIALGRPASGEVFDRGRLTLELEVRIGERLRRLERARYEGGEASVEAPWGLGGHSVFGSFYAVPGLPRFLAPMREATAAKGEALFAMTCVEDVLVGRALASGIEPVRHVFTEAWKAFRLLSRGAPAVEPRIWKT